MSCSFYFKCVIVSLLGSAIIEQSRSAGLQRSKRFLIFPRQAPTRYQFIGGIGIPADLEYESLTTGYVLKAQYWLPYNATVFRENPFWPEYRNRYNDSVGVYAVNSRKSTLRWSLYSYIADRLDRRVMKGILSEPNVFINNIQSLIEAQLSLMQNHGPIQHPCNDHSNSTQDLPIVMLRTIKRERARSADDSRSSFLSYGHKGFECVLKAICEASLINFQRRHSVFAELIHIFLSPSMSADKEIPESSHYKQAEKIGKSVGDCDFYDCKISLLNWISSIMKVEP